MSDGLALLKFCLPSLDLQKEKRKGKNPQAGRYRFLQIDHRSNFNQLYLIEINFLTVKNKKTEKNPNVIPSLYHCIFCYYLSACEQNCLSPKETVVIASAQESHGKEEGGEPCMSTCLMSDAQCHFDHSVPMRPHTDTVPGSSTEETKLRKFKAEKSSMAQLQGLTATSSSSTSLCSIFS